LVATTSAQYCAPAVNPVKSTVTLWKVVPVSEPVPFTVVGVPLPVEHHDEPAVSY
jgi:hypothetical protein